MSREQHTASDAIDVRHHRGQTSDPRFATLAAAAEGLFDLAAARRP